MYLTAIAVLAFSILVVLARNMGVGRSRMPRGIAVAVPHLSARHGTWSGILRT